MGRTRFSHLLLLSALLLLMHSPRSELIPNFAQNPVTPAPFHRFCISQFALANLACASLSYGPVPLPSSVQKGSPLFDKHSHHRRHHQHHHSEGHKRRRRHSHHRHRHRRHHHRHDHDMERETEKECCRWMKAIDDICICDMLFRLPGVLSRPIHKYVVLIDDDCKVEYKCPGRLIETLEGSHS